MAITIRYTKPTLIRKDMDAVLQTMVDEKIGPGEKRREFIKLFALYIDKKDGIAVRSYVDAIAYSIQALKLEENSTIAISLFAPRVYEYVIKKLGYNIFLTDSDEYSQPKIEDVQRAIIENNVKALIVFSPLGSLYRNVDDYKELSIPIIEDVSESLASEFEEVKAGSLGDIVICQFEEDGIISTAGGAIAVSRSQEIIDSLKKETEKIRKYTDLPDMNASLGIMQLQKLDNTIARRREIFNAFYQSLIKGEGKPFLTGNKNFLANGYTFPVVIENMMDEALQFSEKMGIEVKKSFTSTIGYKYLDRFDLYPNSVGPLSRCISFPLYPLLKSTDVDTIEKVLRHIS